MKIQRHAAILRVVRERRIESQDDLRGALASEGFIVTQAMPSSSAMLRPRSIPILSLKDTIVFAR